MENRGTILITGIAGFIGFHLARLLSKNYHIVGLDNINEYYDVQLKFDRLKELGIKINKKDFAYKSSILKIDFHKLDLNDTDALQELFDLHKFDFVVHLAAQAGVRYSLINPKTYIDNNINVFFNLLEVMNSFSVKNLIYASSSSVYGSNEKIPFEENDITSDQVSLYAATKKINETLANTYSHLYNLKAVGLRFFTVYGSYGRPDMAYFKFSNSLMNNQKIDLYNFGNQTRDFTHVNDITNGIQLIIEQFDKKNIKPIYNIGSGNPIELKILIKNLESNFKKKFKINKVGHQVGDVKNTLASVELMKKDFNFLIKKKFENGIQEFVNWYKEYYGE